MSRSALIVVDMLSSYGHADADKLTRSVRESLPAMTGLIRRARDEDALTIYVNDNYGNWNSDRHELVEIALAGKAPELVEAIAPRSDDLFVVKARHSIFYDTPLQYILEHDELTPVAIIGQVTEQCVLYSVLDAHIRHLPVIVARDAIAAIDRALADAALKMMEVNMDAEVCDAEDLRFSASS